MTTRWVHTCGAQNLQTLGMGHRFAPPKASGFHMAGCERPLPRLPSESIWLAGSTSPFRRGSYSSELTRREAGHRGRGCANGRPPTRLSPRKGTLALRRGRDQRSHARGRQRPGCAHCQISTVRRGDNGRRAEATARRADMAPAAPSVHVPPPRQPCLLPGRPPRTATDTSRSPEVPSPAPSTAAPGSLTIVADGDGFSRAQEKSEGRRRWRRLRRKRPLTSTPALLYGDAGWACHVTARAHPGLGAGARLRDDVRVRRTCACDLTLKSRGRGVGVAAEISGCVLLGP
ncbi:hypothetical protein NN561_000495 [Cricetulus griseus]